MKFTPYTLADDSLVRERLIAFALNASPQSARTALLTAPAGYGKSTLLCHIKDEMEARGAHAIWLNCGTEDSEPDVFLSNLNAAFHAARLTDRLTDFGVADLTRLMSESAPTTLLIDEYENASSEGVDTLLENLIRSLPPDCYLFVASRNIPGISMSKLLLDGRVRVVDAVELRLTEAEASRIVADADLSAPYTDLIEQSEGWPVMVQLARLDSQTSGGQTEPIAPMLGQSVGIFDYLAEQVLTKMDPGQRDFLLEISILTEVDVLSAQAVTGARQAEKQVHDLLNLRPIVSVISERPLALRLHPLLRDFLRHESARYPVTDPGELNRRAALHFAERKNLSKAIHHASKAGSEDFVADILENAGGALLSISEGHGRVRSFLANLSPSTITRRPRLHLMRIMQRALAGVSAEWIAEFDHFLDSHSLELGQASDDLKMQVDLIRGIAESTENKKCRVEPSWSRIDEIRRKCLARKFDEPRYLGLGLAIELVFLVDYGTLALAEQRSGELTELFTSANFAPNFSWLSNHLSHLGLAKGDLESSISYARAGLDRVSDLGETRNILIRQHCNAILGQCYFEQNRFDLALDHFAKVPKNMAYSLISLFVASVCSEARIRSLRGEGEQALADLKDAYAFASREEMPHFRVIAAATIAEFFLLAGNMDECLAWIDRENFEHVLEKSQLWFTRPWLETEALVRLFTLLWIRQDELGRAHDLAHEFAIRARQGGRKLMAARAEILLVEVALKQNRRNVAQQALCRALDDTEGSKVLRPFLELSAAGGSLLKNMRRKKGQAHAVRLNNLVAAMENRTEADISNGERLSPREKEVLIGLSQNHSPKIIARNLDLSYETVRHHLKNLYAKLDVHSQEQAVDEARRRSIISHN